MSTQPSDTKTTQGPAKIIAMGVVGLALVAGGAYLGFKKSAEPVQQATAETAPQVFNEFLVVTGKKSNETVAATLTMPGGTEISIPERLTLDKSRTIFSYEGQGNDYILTAELRDQDDHVRKLAMALHNKPMMIIINIAGFSPEEGLDLYVGPNSISTRLPVDWSGSLQQTIPLPIEPQGPFCLVMSDNSKVETVRVCHELPPRKREGLLG